MKPLVLTTQIESIVKVQYLPPLHPKNVEDKTVIVIARSPPKKSSRLLTPRSKRRISITACKIGTRRGHLREIHQFRGS